MRRAVVAVLAGTLGLLGAAVPTASASTASITLSPISPSSPKVGDTLHFTIDVSGTTGPQPLVVQRHDRRGDQPPDSVMTDANGHYDYSDTADVRGRISYVVTLSTDTSVSAGRHVLVAGLTPSLTIGASRPIVPSGSDVRITAKLGTTSTNRTVAIFARPFQRDRHLLRRGQVGLTSGKLSVKTTQHRRTTYSAHFNGDDKYAPVTVRIIVRTRAVIGEHLVGGYGTDGALRLYHATAHPVLVAHLHPELDGVCLWFKAERFFNGSWHSVAARCFTTDANGYARGEFTGAHLNSPYRVRARWRGSKAAMSRNGAWIKLEFR